jgi:hypothetical protein
MTEHMRATKGPQQAEQHNEPECQKPVVHVVGINHLNAGEVFLEAQS